MKNSSSFVIIVGLLVENVGVGHNKGDRHTPSCQELASSSSKCPRPYSISKQERLVNQYQTSPHSMHK